MNGRCWRALCIVSSYLVRSVKLNEFVDKINQSCSLNKTIPNYKLKIFNFYYYYFLNQIIIYPRICLDLSFQVDIISRQNEPSILIPFRGLSIDVAVQQRDDTSGNSIQNVHKKCMNASINYNRFKNRVRRLFHMDHIPSIITAQTSINQVNV